MPRAPLVLALLLHGCADHKPPVDPGTPKELAQGFQERGAKVLEQDHYGDHASRVVYLDQNWGPAETLWFYHADQGSMLMPYQMLVHLEQADSTTPLIDPSHLAKYRFLNQHTTPNNPDALPVGFARHDDAVGLTCAACHTGQINYQGTAIRVDGAPALIDVVGFFRAIEAAQRATLGDAEKLARYAASLPGGGTDAESLAAARADLETSLAWFASYNTVNHSTTTEGFARLDAVVRILNQAIRFTSDPKYSVETNSPTSFPLLWDIPRHDYVQWTGFAPNAGAGSLARNAGEVVGVFGHVEVKNYKTEEEAKKGYKSSIAANNLVSMEETLRSLQSPQWPEEILGAIDRSKASRGAEIYKTECERCHALLDRDDPRRKVTAMVTSLDTVGTDPTAANNLVYATVPSGILEGAISPFGQTYGPTMPALSLIADLDVRVVSAFPEAAVRAIANAKLAGLEETEKQGDHPAKTDDNPRADLLAYKARPLNGTWASSPYLHNGSVPDLYSLLLPPDQRPARFAIGRLEYDPQKVGYRSDGDVPFVLDTTLTGNANQGHLFGTTLSEPDRLALLEYLKTL